MATEPQVTERPVTQVTRRRRGNPVTWVKSGGLTTLLFALPMTLVFLGL